MYFKLDDSGQRPGVWYDRLILDLNRNMDLTDDPIFGPAQDGIRSNTPAPRWGLVYGPIPVEIPSIGTNRKAVYYALVNYNADRLAQVRAGRGVLPNEQNAYDSPYIGSLTLVPGWYLECDVELGGEKTKIALVDNDANFRLERVQFDLTNIHPLSLLAGDTDVFHIQTAGSNASYALQVFSDLIYFRGKPSEVSIIGTFTAIRFEPWGGPVGEVVIEPEGRFVRGMTLLRETQPNKAEFLVVDITNGTCQLPVGRYVFRDVQVSVESADGMVDHFYGSSETNLTFTVQKDKPASVKCGPPLKIEVFILGAPPKNSVRRFIAKLLGRTKSEITILASVTGQAGEAYIGRRYKQGKRVEGFGPQLTISHMGTPVESGTMEFG